jgi:hypothetical protein
MDVAQCVTDSSSSQSPAMVMASAWAGNPHGLILIAAAGHQ